MKKKLFWKYLLICGFICLALIIIIFSIFLLNKSKKLEIIFLNVGQGDSSLIKLPNRQVILIDGGPDNLVLKRLGENLPFYRRRLDYIIVSHFHDDHLIGLIEVINRYKIGSIIYMKGEERSVLGSIFIRMAKLKKINLIAVENEATLNYFPGCFIKILNPVIFAIKNDGNNSLISKLSCQKETALFTGDNNFKIEAALLKTGEDWSAKILKAAHHGSKSANSEMFLRGVNPSWLIISVGINNRFGHPSAEIVSRAAYLGLPIKRTDQDGTIKIIEPE